MINNEKTLSLDRQWRLFFYGENHQLISNILASIFNDFLKKGLKYKIILENPENEQILKRVEENDISHTSKLADTYFETIFINRAGNRIKCILSSALKKFQKESALNLSINEIENLKIDIHKCGQFETISKIILQARNINAHWHTPIEDSGNAALVSGSILRLLELFELKEFSNDKLEKLRELCINLIKSIGLFETIENYDVNDDEIIIKIPTISNKSELNSVDNIPLDIINNEAEIDIQDIDLPDIDFNPKNTNEQKRQLLTQLRYKILGESHKEKIINKSNCIISRQSISELLELKILGKENLFDSLTILYLKNNFKETVEYQINHFGKEIINILSEK